MKPTGHMSMHALVYRVVNCLTVGLLLRNVLFSDSIMMRDLIEYSTQIHIIYTCLG